MGWTTNPFLTLVHEKFFHIALALRVSAYFHRSMRALIRAKDLQPSKTEILGQNIVYSCLGITFAKEVNKLANR